MKSVKLNNGIEMPQMGYGVHHSAEAARMFMGWK